MSLHYIIDGYNLIKHPCFVPSGKADDARIDLLIYIRNNNLCGSQNNRVTVVFDGYSDILGYSNHYSGINIIFSGAISADEKIKTMVECEANSKSIVVVTDDFEIRFCVKAAGATAMRIEEFILPVEKSRKAAQANEAVQQKKLNISQMHKINEEFKKIWLKEE
jgi:predicted RNA-binding protein with PIN domain